MEIGKYRQPWAEYGLTENHVSETADGIRIEGPALTSELRVDVQFLEEKFGGWASDEPFTPGEGKAIFEGRTAELHALEVGEIAYFTWGHESQVQFLERPMWVSAQQDEPGGAITLQMDDGDTTGQTIYVAKEWLWERGIHRPNATHEDGTSLNVTLSEDGRGFIISVHHFSWVALTAQDITVKGYRNGQFVTHMGAINYETSQKILKVDVPLQLLYDYEVWVERDWVLMNVPDHALIERSWRVDQHQGMDFLVVSVPKAETPTTLDFRPFSPTLFGFTQFTAGSVGSVYFFADPLFATMLLQSNSVGVQTLLPTDLGNHTGQIGFNYAWLALGGITTPTATTGSVNVTSYGSSNGVWQYGIRTAGLVTHEVVQGAGAYNLGDGRCELAEGGGKSFGPWNDEYPGHGSWVKAYVVAGTWCWEWEMTLGPEVTASELLWYQAAGGVWDETNPDLGCRMGNAATATVVNDKGAMVCEWPEGEEISDISLSFFGTQVLKTEYEERYSGKATWTNCYAGGGFNPSPAAIQWIPILVAIGLGIAIVCGALWIQKAFYKIWHDNHDADDLVRERLIVQDVPVSAPSGISIQIRDSNSDRFDTWNRIEDLGLYFNPQRHGPQYLDWDIENVGGATGTYIPDISLIKEVETFDGGQRQIKNDGQRLDFNANDGISNLVRTINLNVVDWEAPEDLCSVAFRVQGMIGGALKMLDIGGPSDPSCPGDGIKWRYWPVDEASDPLFGFDVLDTDIVSPFLMANSGVITMQDVLDANGSVPMAVAQLVVDDDGFLSTLDVSESPFAPAPGEACPALDSEYTAQFTATTEGTSTVDNLERSGADAISRLICFQHAFLDGQSGGGA